MITHTHDIYNPVCNQVPKMTTAGHRSVFLYYYSALLALSYHSTEALIKEWNPLDTDWQNRNNWDGGRLPCWRSRAILPEEVVISVFVNGSVAWRELVMPQTGELVLDDLTLISDTQEACQHPTDIKFKHWKPSSWFDPDRWQIAQSDGTVIPQPLSIPHSERIPCAHDSVHLTKKHSLSVDFNRVHSLTVGQVKYDDQPLTLEEWRDRLNGQDWRYQVHNPPRSVYVNGTDCQDALGCRCGHDVDVMQMVCSNAGILCASQIVECPNGFRPPGHCCDMCGAMMKITVDERIFTKSSLDRLISSSMLVEDGWAQSQSYSYRTDENILHLIISDNTTNENSIRLANKIQEYLEKDKSSSNLYGIVALEMIRSGLSYPAIHHLTPEELHLIASNVTTVFATLIVIAAVGAGLYFYKKHRWTSSRDEISVGFARFQNDSSGNVEIAIDASFEQALARPPLEGATPSHRQDSPFEEAPTIPDTPDTSRPAEAIPTESKTAVKVPAAWKKFTRAFTNPLFGDASASATGRMSARWTMSSLMKSTATQENPIYNIDIPDPSLVTNPPTTTDAEIPVSPVSTRIVGLDRAEGGVGDESNVTPLADTFPAVADDDVLPAVEETAAATTTAVAAQMEDVSLVDDGTSEKNQCPDVAAAPNGAKHPLKRLWNKAAKKWTPQPPPPAGPAVLSTSDAEQTAETLRPAPLQSQQAEDEMQLTLAEETDE